MSKAETVQPLGRGDSKERAKLVAGGAVIGAARGAANEYKRQRGDLLRDGVGAPLPGAGRIRGTVRRELAIVREVGIIDLGRAALIGAGQGAAVAGVAETGKRISKSTKSNIR